MVVRILFLQICYCDNNVHVLCSIYYNPQDNINCVLDIYIYVCLSLLGSLVGRTGLLLFFHFHLVIKKKMDIDINGSISIVCHVQCISVTR